MPIDCGDLNVPEPPKFDASKIPTGVNLPKGMSVDSLKAKAENPGFSDRLKNAGSAIGANIKNTVSQLNPAAIAEKAAGAVAGMVGNIKDSITHMADGLTSLKDKIAGFDPAEKLKGMSPDSPKGMFENMKNQAKARMDGLGSAFKNKGMNCGKAGLGAAGDVSASATGAAKGALAGLSNKDRIEMAKNPEVKQAKIDQATEAAKQETTAKVTESAKKPEKEKSVQQTLHSDTLPIRLGVELGDCTGHVREQFMANTLNAIYYTLVGGHSGVYPSYLFRKYPKEGFFSKDHSAAARNIITAIEYAARIRAWGGILTALDSGYNDFCDERPKKSGLMHPEQNSFLTYHDYMINNYYSLYSHDNTDGIKIPSSHFTLYRPAFGVIKQIHVQNAFWQFWQRGGPGYFDRYLRDGCDLSNISNKLPTTSEPGYWVHLESKSAAGRFISSPYVREIVGEKPREVYLEALGESEAIDYLNLLNQDHKNNLISIAEGELGKDHIQSSVVDSGGTEGFLASGSFLANVDNPAYMVMYMATGSVGLSGKTRLYPGTIMLGINFNFSSGTIDSIEYLGENELLREHIK